MSQNISLYIPIGWLSRRWWSALQVRYILLCLFLFWKGDEVPFSKPVPTTMSKSDATHDVAKKHPKDSPFHSIVFTTRPHIRTRFGTLGQCGICWLRSCGVSLWGTSVGAVILRSSRMVDGFDGARPPQRGIPKQKKKWMRSDGGG